MAQLLLSPGGEAGLHRNIIETTVLLSKANTVLDIGCGPSSIVGAQFGLDVSESYIKAFSGLGVIGSATELPFPSRAFDAVVCFGLLHHLDALKVRSTLHEMKRVAKYWALVTDPVLPRFRDNPWAWAIRKLDRGGRVRTENELRELLEGWDIRRFKYTVTGLEGLIAHFRNP
jgi:ubiquinone/menaquinone biosynthesis C-methylase UbiE